MQPMEKVGADIITQKLKRLCQLQSSTDILQDEYGLFIPPSGSLTQFSQHTFDLTGAVQDFLEGEKSVLLLMGESGSGKSLFSQSFIMKKAQQYQPSGVIPLFISLPTLKNPKTQLLQEFFKRHDFTADDIEQLRLNHKFLFVLDAFDEINLLENLYLKNNLNQWQAKVIITCRTSYLVNVDDYRKLFMPYRGERALSTAFHELYVAPFVSAQITLYIKQYITVKKSEIEEDILLHPEMKNEWLDFKMYEQWIDHIDGLKTLVKTPFLLRITMEVLPSVVVEFQSNQSEQNRLKMTQAKLYDAFVKRWFSRQEDKYISKGESVGRNFQKYCLSFSKSLAKKMHEKHLSSVHYEEGITENPFDENDSAPAEDYKEWAIFFSNVLVPQDKNNEDNKELRIRARKACPLRKVGPNQYAFLHASLLEYFVSLVMQDALGKQPVNKPAPESPPASKPSALKVQENRKVLGEFILMEELNREEASQLQKEEGIKIDFLPIEQTKAVVLGRGQYGAFHVGRNTINQRFVGIKAISDQGIADSKREAEIQSQLNGLQNVMPLWHSEELANPHVLYQIMPLAGFGNGELVRDYFSRIADASLRKKFFVHIARSMLTGVKNMHTRRVYHLDLKPANFVLDCRGTLYLIDFGCAVREYSNKEDTLLVQGNGDIRYFSPDRAARWRHFRKLKGENITGPGTKEIHQTYDAAKTDVWAVGISLLEILRGTYPVKFSDTFRSQNEFILSEWCSDFFHKSFPRLYQLSDQSTDLIGLLLKALLNTDPVKCASTREALTFPIFTHPDYQLTPNELTKVMTQLMEWKLAPPTLQVAAAPASKPTAISSAPNAGYQDGSTLDSPPAQNASPKAKPAAASKPLYLEEQSGKAGANYVGDFTHSPQAAPQHEAPVSTMSAALKSSPVFGNASKPAAVEKDTGANNTLASYGQP